MAKSTARGEDQRRLRIGFVSPTFPPAGDSGIGGATLHLALGLRALGHEVSVFTWLDGIGRSDETVEGIRVRRLGATRTVDGLQFAAAWLSKWPHVVLRDGQRKPLDGFLRALRGQISGRIMRRLGWFDGVNVLEAPEWGGGAGALAGANNGQTCLLKLHGSSYSHFHSYRPHAMLSPVDVALTCRLEMCGASGVGVLSPSRYMALEAARYLGISRPIAVVPNCVDLPWLDRRANAGKRRAHDDGRIMIAFSGRLDDMKGGATLNALVGVLRADHSGSRWRVMVIGDGKHREKYGQLKTSDDRVSVTLTGRVPSADVIPMIAQADVFLFPSQSENCPMSLLEAMGCGRAVVAARVGGVPELVDDGVTGLLCGKTDIKAMTQALSRLVDPSERAILGVAARRAVEKRFSSEVVAARWLEACIRTPESL